MQTREQRRTWRAANPEKVRKHKADSYARHVEAIRERARAARDPEVERARAKAWRAANPERARRSNRDKECSRRARRRGQFVEHVKAFILWQMHGGCCGICGEFIDTARPYPDDRSLTIDHRVPLVKGGAHGYVNCQPAHLHCNLVKGVS